MADARCYVVAVDFSEHSTNAVLQAMRLAGQTGARLRLVHVVESMALRELAQALGRKDAELQSNTIEKKRRRLEQLVQAVGADPDRIDLEVCMGNPFDAVSEVVEERKADLLVLGSRGTTRARDGASVLAIKCIRKLATRVLIVRKEHTTPFKEIGAFIDFTEKTPAVVQQAVHLAQHDRSKLHLYHVYLPPWKVQHHRSNSAMTPEEQDAHREKLKQDLAELTKPHNEAVAGIKVDYSLIESSERVVGIDEFIEESGVDLVVLNTRQRTGWRAILLRTIAEHIIRTSPCSVMTVKSPELM